MLKGHSWLSQNSGCNHSAGEEGRGDVEVRKAASLRVETATGQTAREAKGMRKMQFGSKEEGSSPEENSA